MTHIVCVRTHPEELLLYRSISLDLFHYILFCWIFWKKYINDTIQHSWRNSSLIFFFYWKIVWNCFRFWKILKNEFKRVEDPLDIAFSPEAHKISSMVVSGNFCLDKECVFENFLKGKLVLWCLIFRGI